MAKSVASVPPILTEDSKGLSSEDSERFFGPLASCPSFCSIGDHPSVPTLRAARTVARSGCQGWPGRATALATRSVLDIRERDGLLDRVGTLAAALLRRSIARAHCSC
jgi:hypothetical protein